jgi:guanosine-3',5'-bis(diphosphate) 3'-pyrophosphohydrolase
MKTVTTAGFQKLLDALPQEYGMVEREMVQRAYEVAERDHAGQKRASGEPYINHCIAVAIILAELRVPPEVIVAGLLHDTVEDTSLTLDDIRRDFGETVASLVDGVTKLANLPRVSRGDEHDGNGHEPVEALTSEQLSKRKREMATEALRKTFMAMGDDVRVVLIKLADRLHNMRTLGYTKPDKQRRVAQETLDIFAPLANRLGIWQIKWELEDLAFRYVNPEKYKEIAEQLAERREIREQQVDEIIERLQTLLEKNGIEVDISGRPKHIYSIYRKMLEKGKTFEMVRDLRGVRLIVPDIPACYATLGVIHTTWRPIPNEFDDYIANPKDNFYRSLHTAVIYDDGKPLEVQIRTSEMNQDAEYGIAAHWRYKEGVSRDQTYEQRILWLRSMMEWRQDVTDAQDFVDGMKTDVFQDRVYVFTPRGDIIDLPAGSTPIDFAYHVHTDIGHRCRGAKVDGKLVPLDRALHTGEQVEILTSKQGGPSRDWLNANLSLVKTQRARAKIRLWFKKQDREQNLSQGREVLEHELQRLGLVDVNLEDLAKELELKNPEEMFVDIGCGDISISKIVKQLADRLTSPDQDMIIPISAPRRETSAADAVTVVGLKGILTATAKCCNPTPGDPIVGYVTRGRGATIHRQDCPNILRMTMKDRERLVRVSWGENVQTYPVPVRVTAFDRQGLMGDISNLLNNEGVNILDVNVHIDRDTVHADIADIRLIVEVRDIEQLSRMLTRIENLPNVLEAQRVRAG